MKVGSIVLCMAVVASPVLAQDASAPTAQVGAVVIAPERTLPAGTPIVVVINEDLSTKTNRAGDKFTVTVVNDVVQDGAIVIPKGTPGSGEVTFRTGKGGFGKSGILGIALRNIVLGDRRIALDGRYRQEGGENQGAAAAVMFAVGIAAVVVHGKTGIIPKGRELKGRTGEDLTFTGSLKEAKVMPIAITAPEMKSLDSGKVPK